MKKILPFLILYISGSVSAQSLNIDSLAIGEYFNPWNETDGPGAAFAILQKEKVVYSKCFGKSDLSGNSLITTKTNFRIASTSKQFTGACIRILERDHQIQLTDSIGKYLPNYPKYLYPITIDQLLHRTSGIRPFYDIGYLKGFTNYEFSEQEVFEWINMQSQLQSIPGEEYAYCNTNYWLLGKIVESISNQTLEEFAKERIFQPLGMHQTKFVRNRNTYIENRAFGYGTRKDSLVIIEEPLETIGESGIYTNLEDLTKWVNGFYYQNYFDTLFL